MPNIKLNRQEAIYTACDCLQANTYWVALLLHACMVMTFKSHAKATTSAVADLLLTDAMAAN